MTLADTLRRALAPRFYPYSDLSPKQLAFALGVSPATLWKWKEGVHDIPGEALMAMIAFFRARGDYRFETEIMAAIPRETSVQNGESWRVERLPLDAMRHPTAQKLAALASSESDLLTAADNAGLLPLCSLYRRVGREVILLTIGKNSQMPQRIADTMVGLAVSAWPERPYREMVESRILEAEEHGLVYDRRAGLLAGKPAPYNCLTVPAGRGYIASLTERLAA